MQTQVNQGVLRGGVHRAPPAKRREFTCCAWWCKSFHPLCFIDDFQLISLQLDRRFWMNGFRHRVSSIIWMKLNSVFIFRLITFNVVHSRGIHYFCVTKQSNAEYIINFRLNFISTRKANVYFFQTKPTEQNKAGAKLFVRKDLVTSKL